MKRFVPALGFGVLVWLTHAILFLFMMLLAALVGQMIPVLGAVIGVAVVAVGLPLSLGVGAIAVYNWLEETPWRSVRSPRATILLALAGHSVGQVLGAMFLETGHLRGGGLPSLLGAAVGCVTLLAFGNLRTRHVEHSGLGLGPTHEPHSWRAAQQ